jgi:hypothetical protein
LRREEEVEKAISIFSSKSPYRLSEPNPDVAAEIAMRITAGANFDIFCRKYAKFRPTEAH